jgi:hypothetical protein
MHDVVVVSDFHIGRGRNPRTSRFHTLETFFYDDDLRRFCRWICEEAKARQAPLRLVFNGDTFDFLRIDVEGDDGSSARERRFGPDLSPPVAAHVLRDILAGHPVFVEALADVLEAGHEIVFLPGNHDVELGWAPVQEELRQAVRKALASRAGVLAADGAIDRLVFKPWFHHEPGRLWIEHGCQYDPECSFRWPLRGPLAAGVEDPKSLELDMPLGNFFQKYLYNAFGPLTFIVPSTRANARYVRWLLLHEPRLLFRVVGSHLPFIVQVLRRLAEKGSSATRALKEAHESTLEELARTSGLGETLRKIDQLKNVKLDVLRAATEYGRQALLFTSAALAVALAGAGLWFTGVNAIGELQAGFGLKAMLFLLLNFLMITGVVGGALFTVLRTSPAPTPRPLRTGAQQLVNLLDVPVVTFGHTHDEVVWPLARPAGGPAWYYNTGTWIAVFTHDVLLPRERVQFTFLRVRGLQGELLHWSPGRNEALPVILLDEMEPHSVLAPVSGVQPAA